MSDHGDGVVALDIETASPDTESDSIDFTNTDCFELIAVGLGYQSPDSTAIESTVLFRQNGWETSARVELLHRMYEWISERNPAIVLTYNGTNFDTIHLQEWAQRAANDDYWPRAPAAMDEVFANHVDLHEHAMATYRHMLQYNRTGISLEMICDWENISLTEVPIDHSHFVDVDWIDPNVAEYVTGRLVGSVLGEQYLERTEQGIDDEITAEVERLLREYTRSDIEPLFELADAFNVDAYRTSLAMG